MSDKIIELKLGWTSQLKGDGSQQLLELIDRLLELISEVAVGNEALKADPELRRRITELRRTLTGERDTAESVMSLADRCLSECEDFFSRAREQSLNREIEFIEIIDTLRETLRSLAGQSVKFNDSLLGSTERFNRLLEIDNLEAIKKQIVVEARDLNRTIEEKSRAEQESYSKLSGRIEKLQERLARAEEDAMLDALTGVANRGSFDRTIKGWVDAYNAGQPGFTLAVVDLDDFKKINDSYGHQIGDRVLICAASILQQSTRSGDMVARYGGEEFVVLLRDCPIDQASERLNAVLESMSEARYEYTRGKFLRFTASIGLAECAGTETVANLVARADEAMYEAKARGKNRIVHHTRYRLRRLFGSGKRTSAA